MRFSKGTWRLLTIVSVLWFTTAAFAQRVIPAGTASGNIPSTGGGPTLSGISWEVVQGSQVIATSNSPNGWNVMELPLGYTDVTVPAGVTAGDGFAANWQFNDLGVISYLSVSFSVINNVAQAVAEPTWAEDNTPKLEEGSGSDGPSAYDYTELYTGVRVHAPPADITATNQYGPSASYQRMYRSSLALAGGYAPGLTPGWTDTLEFSFTPSQPGQWGNMLLHYPNTATETFTPVMSGGNAPLGQQVVGGGSHPTGAFTDTDGAPFTLTGSPSSTTGDWNSLTIQFKDLSSWVFYPVTGNPNLYYLARVYNGAGRYIAINRDSSNGFRLSSIADDNTPTADTLLAFAYAGGTLSKVTDEIGSREVDFGYQYINSVNCLTSASQEVSAGSQNPPARFSYSYDGSGWTTALTSVSTPNQAGSGMNSNTVNYDPYSAMVDSSVDADGNEHDMSYSAGATTVSIHGPNGSPLTFKQNFVKDLSTGFTDSSGNSEIVHYTDPSNPYLPTQIINRDGQTSYISYDAHGNVATTTVPASTSGQTIVTTNIYTYPSYAPNGLIYTSQDSNGSTKKTATQYNYYATTGLLSDGVGYGIDLAPKN